MTTIFTGCGHCCLAYPTPGPRLRPVFTHDPAAATVVVGGERVAGPATRIYIPICWGGTRTSAVRGALRVLRLTNARTRTHARKPTQDGRGGSSRRRARGRGDDNGNDDGEGARPRSSGPATARGPRNRTSGLTCTLTSLTTRTPYWTRLLAEKKGRGQTLHSRDSNAN